MASVEKIIIPVKMFSHLRGEKCIIMPKYVFKRYQRFTYEENESIKILIKTMEEIFCGYRLGNSYLFL